METPSSYERSFGGQRPSCIDPVGDTVVRWISQAPVAIDSGADGGLAPAGNRRAREIRQGASENDSIFSMGCVRTYFAACRAATDHASMGIRIDIVKRAPAHLPTSAFGVHRSLGDEASVILPAVRDRLLEK